MPADGRVIAGSTAVNEATITGESVPRAKDVGDTVFASTMNTDGAVDVVVTADAAHSTLARIVQLVREAEQRRAPIEHFVKRFARVYTPAVTLVAAAVMIVPALLGQDALEWFVRGLTLLVIACPCALVIATPVTVVSALTSAARHGVLVKGGEQLEALGRVRALAVDKTGTLTTGRLAVVDFQHAAGDRDALLRRVAAVEARSEHPIAQAIVRYADSRGVRALDPVEEFAATPGRGVRGRVDGEMITVGTDQFVGPLAVAGWGPGAPTTTRVYAESSGGARGAFVLRDEPRPEARRVLARLRRLGIKPLVMLTGDAPAAADAMASLCGVDETHGGLLPADKVDVVRALRARYGGVAMLGDGVNDAPALAEATVGIAMGAAGSPATIETADVALMADELTKLPYAFTIARRTWRTVRVNIALALALKVVLAAGAVVGITSLAAAVRVGDMGGSLAVTINAIRLAGTRE